MSEEKKQGFSHIVVGDSFDDDDVVIVAGAPSEEPLPPEASQADEPEVEAEVRPEPASEPEPEPEVVEEPVAEDDAGEAPAPARRDEYRATTLEDLESSSMPLTQKVVIVAAVVLIVIAVAWFMLH